MEQSMSKIIGMFIAALFTIAKTQKQSECPLTDEWIKKMWYIYTGEHYSARRRNRIGSFAVMWMDQSLLYRVKSEREKQVSIYRIQKDGPDEPVTEDSNRDTDVGKGCVNPAGDGEGGTN